MSEVFDRARELIDELRVSGFSSIPDSWEGVVSEPYFVDPSDVLESDRLLILENLLTTLRLIEGSDFFSSLQFDLEDDFDDCADGDEFYGFDDYLYELVLEDVPLNDFAHLAQYLLSVDSLLNLTSEWFLRGSFVSRDSAVSVIWYSLGESDEHSLFYVRDNRDASETVLSL